MGDFPLFAKSIPIEFIKKPEDTRMFKDMSQADIDLL
jgi:hypothetical protein